jgi:hypothetical protein
MATAMMMDRLTATGFPTATPTVPTAPNMVMVPRCTMKLEKVSGGLKLTCVCDDPTACSMLQNLCQVMAGGLCSLCCMQNGMVVCCCNLTCGACKVEMTKDGCCVTCTSGDKACCDIIQSCCDCVAACMKGGCTCCLTIGGTPVCCCIC